MSANSNAKAAKKFLFSKKSAQSTRIATAATRLNSPAYAPIPVYQPVRQKQEQPRLEPKPRRPRRGTPSAPEKRPEPHYLLVKLPDGKQLDSSKGEGLNGLDELLAILPDDAKSVISEAEATGFVIRIPYIASGSETEYQKAVAELRDEFKSREWFTKSGHHVAYVVPGTFDNVPEHGDGAYIVGRYANLPVARCAEVTESRDHRQSTSLLGQIEHVVGLDQFRNRTLTGQGVQLYVVDTRMESPIEELVSRAWKEELAASRADGASTDAWHATMVATVARWVAPSARIVSCPALELGTDSGTKLRRIYEALAELLWEQSSSGKPVVVVNSWAVRSFAFDAPKGDARSYRYSLNYPLTQMFSILSDARDMNFVFASGNCGEPSPDRGCDPAIQGEGQIAGANASPSVLTVGACDTDGQPRPYTSQGPGTIAPHKPDLACPTDYELDGRLVAGSSGAAPLAAGVLACLCSTTAPAIPHDSLRRLLCEATRKSRGIWEHSVYVGWGLLDAGAALAVADSFT